MVNRAQPSGSAFADPSLPTTVWSTTSVSVTVESTLPPTTAEPAVSLTTLPPLTAPRPPVAAPAITAKPPPSTLPLDCFGLDVGSSGSKVYVGADGQERTYELAMPRMYDGTRATPLILNFHAYLGTGLQHETNTLMGQLATQRGYVVVSPDSTTEPPSWNAGAVAIRLDDFAFAQGLIAELQATMCIDATRIYAAGHSNGGMFAAALVCRAPFPFAAVAVVAALPLSGCPPEAQPAVIEIMGTADELIPYDGSARRPGAIESIKSWAVHAGCVDPPVTALVEAGVEATRFDGCAGADVELLTVVDGMHPWPGGPVAMSRVGNSESGRTFPATRTILNFFDNHIL